VTPNQELHRLELQIRWLTWLPAILLVIGIAVASRFYGLRGLVVSLVVAAIVGLIVAMVRRRMENKRVRLIAATDTDSSGSTPID
jgi:drug/metabolite transporter (DMT)-like permease